MACSQTDNAVSPDTKPKEPPINAVCIIPELDPRDDVKDGQTQLLTKRVRELYTAFAGRFVLAFTLTIRHGLVPLGEQKPPSVKGYEDLAPEAKHAFLWNLNDQMEILGCRRLPIICLVGGFVTRGLRRLNVEFSMPLSAMSPRMRRSWLETQQGKKNDDVVKTLFGVVFNEALTSPLGR